MAPHNKFKRVDKLPLSEWTDQQLIGLFKRGNDNQCQQVIAVFYQRHAIEVLQLAKSLPVTRTYSHDIASEVWLRFCRKLPEYEWQGKPVLHWLSRTTKHVRLEMSRHINRELLLDSSAFILKQALDFLEQRLKAIEAPDPHEEPLSEVKSAANKWLAQAVAELKPIDRKIINLLYYKNKNSTEIGKILDMTSAAVRKRHERALKKLRRL